MIYVNKGFWGFGVLGFWGRRALLQEGRDRRLHPGQEPADREDYRAEADDEPLDIPVAVLINADTASAAEIVTGALKDTGRAVVVGERSFGKGSVQDIFPLKNGEALRLTTAHYYTPSGVSINQKGITPQVEVVLTADEDFKLSQQLSGRT